MTQIKNNDNIIMDADKNLAIVVMKREDHIKSILKEHLHQPCIYEQLSCLQAHHKMRQVEIKIKNTLPNNNQELSTSEKVSSFADFNLNIESLLSMA